MTRKIKVNVGFLLMLGVIGFASCRKDKMTNVPTNKSYNGIQRDITSSSRNLDLKRTTAPLGNGQFNTYLIGFNHVFQTQPLWCWLASCEMVLRFWNVETTQDAIIRVVRVAPMNVTGTANDIKTALMNVGWITKDSRTLSLSVENHPFNPTEEGFRFFGQTVVEQLKAGKPVILGIRKQGPQGQYQHAVVIREATYEVKGGLYQLISLRVADPERNGKVDNMVSLPADYLRRNADLFLVVNGSAK